MNNPLKDLFASCWHIFTEVPGWPDAPRQLRIRRMIPIIVPLASMALLLVWNLAWNQPHIRRERLAHQPALALAQEIADLRQTFSEQHAQEVATGAAEAGRILFTDPKQVAPALTLLKETALKSGWDSTFHAMTATGPAEDGDSGMYFIPGRAKLTPARDNAEPFTSLLTLLEKLSPTDQWIDLTRLTLRADEQGRYTVELQLRAGCRTPQ